MAINNKEFSSSSRYDIYSKLMNVASKYFDVQNEDFLKTGLFGYITESMAMITRDSSFHKTMLYNESFLNTAVMPKSVYNWAKMFGVSIPGATPAYADIQVTIPVDSLVFALGSAIPNNEKYGTEVTTRFANKQMMILDRGNVFVAGNFLFTLERSVLIYRNIENDDSTITVKYCATETLNTSFQNITNLFIKTYTTTDNYISFVVRAYQYTIEENEKQIVSSSFLDTKIHRFNFTDQFVGAKLFYSKNNVEELIELRFSNIESQEGNTAKFAYYNLTDENQIQVTFSSASGDFLPSANSILRMEIFTTKGANGNINYTGDVLFRFQEESLKNIPVFASFFDQASVGGLDAPSVNRIKSTIINEISTRDVIVTETDLNSYFNILTALLETVNDGKITFIKKRDDILRRVFSAYILMRDGLDINGNVAESGYTSKVIPTNTLTADFQISSNMSKPFGTIIKRKSGTSNEYEYVPSNALDGSDDYYVLPFYLRVTLDPFRKVKYIYNLTDDSTTLSYRDITQTSTEYYVLPSNISVKRDIEGINTSPYYIVTATFVSNFNLADETTDTNGEFNLKFYRRGNETTPFQGASLGFVKNDKLTITSINPDAEDSTRYLNTLEFVIDVEANGNEFDFSSENATNDFGTFINLFHNNQNIALPEDVKIEVEFKNVLNTLNLNFISDNFLSLFRNLDELMYSDIKLNTENIDGTNYITSVTIKDIPVVHQSFFTSEANKSKFIKQLFIYIDILKENLGKLETNTFFDLKFYNSYGFSQYYNTTRTDLDLELDVYVFEYSDDLANAIKDYVRLSVDNSNDRNAIRISNLIKNLETSFGVYIDHVDFKGLNGTFTQYISENSTITKNLYAPEHLNLSEENLVNVKVYAVSQE